MTSDAPERSTDVEEFLRLLHPDGVFEVRILNTSDRRGGTFKSTAAGYFSDLAAAAKYVRQWSRCEPPGIYCTINPARPDLLARSVNKIEFRAKHATNDGDIASRRWLLIDIDPRRPPGTSSTHEEMTESLKAGKAIWGWLSSKGWPDPIRMMSGNGCYLLYQIELANDERSTHLVCDVIRAVASKFNSETIDIDKSVFNASRIAKIGGTFARKGDHLAGVDGVEDRPHRRSFYRSPEFVEIVPVELLEAIVSEFEKSQQAEPTESAVDLTPFVERTNNKAFNRCQHYVDKIPAAVQGDKGSDHTLQAAGTLARFGLSESEGWPILADYNNRCVPPWDEKDLQRKLSEAYKKVRDAGDYGKYIEGDSPDMPGAQGNPDSAKPAGIKPVGIAELIEGFPEMRPVVIDGILRRGETLNLIAAAKKGKSFMAGGLAWSIASGCPWLGHEVVQGRVAIIDNELHHQTLASRLYRIATDMMIDYRDYKDSIDVFPIRGVGLDIHHIGGALASIEPQKYQLVILDALYRTLPDGTSENDNAAMMAIYNRLDHYAHEWDCAVAVVHHASKGDQSGKEITDVGAGAGSISRAADTHLTVRPHEEDGLTVMECVTRSFPSPSPKSVRFDWPLWSVVSTKPILKVPKGKGDARQESDDVATDEAVRAVLKEATPEWLAASSIRRKTKYGQTRVDRSLVRLRKEIESKSIDNPRNKKETIDVFRVA